MNDQMKALLNKMTNETLAAMWGDLYMYNEHKMATGEAIRMKLVERAGRPMASAMLSEQKARFARKG